MNIFQRTLAALFPRSFGKMRRGYQGAVVTRLNSDWLSSQLSPDAEVRNSLRKLRDRSRELSPLLPADDAHIIDSSSMSHDEVLLVVENLIKKEFK